MDEELLPIARDDARGLLTPVLERVEPEVGQVGRFIGPVDTEDAALVVEMIVFVQHGRFIAPRRGYVHGARLGPGSNGPRCARAALFALALLGLGLPATARAHLGSTKYLDVRVTAEGARVEASVETIDASVALGLGERPDEAALLARRDELARWLGDGIEVSGGGRERTATDSSGAARCEVSPGPSRLETRDGRRRFVVELAYACGGPPRELVDRTVFPLDPQHEALVEVRRGGEASAHVLRRGRQRLALDAPRDLGALLLDFGREGMVHFATGYDHVLFLLSLLLAAGVVLRESGARRAFRDVALLVTAFTLGHSVTLAAAATRTVVLPSAWVEVVIAASIVVVALHNVFRAEERGPLPPMAFAFGLVHGFGFSSVLAELGLPPGRSVAALLAFNVGIELAQLAFVAVALVPMARMAGNAGYKRWAVQGGSMAVALVAAYWVVERWP
jgi:hypothetical protein